MRRDNRPGLLCHLRGLDARSPAALHFIFLECCLLGKAIFHDHYQRRIISFYYIKAGNFVVLLFKFYRPYPGRRAPHRAYLLLVEADGLTLARDKYRLFITVRETRPLELIPLPK